MIDRDYRHGPIRVRCDGCAVHHQQSGWTDRSAAMAALRADDWTRRHDGAGHGWCDFCPDCTERRVWERRDAA